MFFGCSCVSGRSELTPLLPAGFGPITSLGTRRRLTLSPRHSSPGRAPHGTCPGVPTAAGAAPGPVHTTPFCSLGRGSGALKPGRNVQGHGEEGGPIPGTAARGTRCGTPRSHARSPHPEAEPGGAEPGGSGAGSRSCPYLVPGAAAAAPGAGAAAAAGPRRGCPSAGSAVPSGSGLSCGVQRAPPFPRCCCCYPSRLRPVGKELAGTPHSVGFTKIEFSACPLNYTACKCSAEQSRHRSSEARTLLLQIPHRPHTL